MTSKVHSSISTATPEGYRWSGSGPLIVSVEARYERDDLHAITGSPSFVSLALRRERRERRQAARRRRESPKAAAIRAAFRAAA
jgi:hypothetical protein